jgi:hypothetical protein
MSNILQNVVSGTQAAANEMQCSSINSCHDKEKLSNKILYTSRGERPASLFGLLVEVVLIVICFITHQHFVLLDDAM